MMIHLFQTIHFVLFSSNSAHAWLTCGILPWGIWPEISHSLFQDGRTVPTIILLMIETFAIETPLFVLTTVGLLIVS